MRKAFTALAVAAAAIAAPIVSTGTAYADSQPTILPVGAIIASVIDNVLIPDGCALTYVGKVARTPIGPVLATPPGGITISYSAVTTYVYAQADNTLWYIHCF